MTLKRKPLTFEDFKPGERVSLIAPNGEKNDFVIDRVATKDGLLLKSGTKHIRAEVDTITIYPNLVIGAFNLSPGDLVKLIGPTGQKMTLKVSLLIDKKALILVPPYRPKKLGFFDKFRIFTSK